MLRKRWADRADLNRCILTLGVAHSKAGRRGRYRRGSPPLAAAGLGFSGEDPPPQPAARKSSASGFAVDSLQEEAGFEPSVPRDTTKLAIASAWFPANGKVGAKGDRHTRRRALPRGTDGSNPVPSSAESANYQFRSRQAASARPGAAPWKRPSSNEVALRAGHRALDTVGFCAPVRDRRSFIRETGSA
jgi:hypothetical protein